MLKNTVKERNIGIDALRILSMFMIVVWHILGQGGVLANTPQFTLNYEIARLLKILVFCSVNCYALISGYVGVDAKYKYTNLVLIWLRTLFYSIGITLLFVFLMPDKVDTRMWFNGVFPVMRKEYWYITAYVGLFVLMPLLNIAIHKMSKRQMRAVLCSTLVLFSVLPTIFRNDYFGLNGGNIVWWLVILYLLGGYIKTYDILCQARSKIVLAVYFGVAVLELLARNCLVLLGKDRTTVYLESNISPVCVVMSVCLLILFSRLELRHGFSRLVEMVAPLSLSVYLIHTHPLIFSYWFLNAFVWLAHLSWYMMTLMIIVWSIGIYAGCSMIDVVREWLFKRLCLKQVFYRIEQKRVGMLWVESNQENVMERR